MSELGSILRLEYGAALSAENRTGWGYPVFGSNGEIGRHARFLIGESGIVVGRKGSVGQVSWSDEPFWPIDTAYWVDCREQNRRWLYWLLSYLPLKRLDTSTGVPGLNRNDVYELDVYRPSPASRDKIAEILDTMDAAIRGTEAVVAKLKAMKQGLLHDLLTRGIDANGDLRPPQPEAPHLYKQTPLGWLPKGWDAVQLGDQLIGGPKNGYSPQDAGRETGVKMLGLGCLTEEGFAPRQLKNAPEAMALHPARLEHGDLLISRSNTIAMVGRVGMYRDVGAPCIYPDLMMKLVPSARYLPEFLKLLLQSERTRRQIQNVAVGTSGSMVKINSKTVRALLIPLVEKEEQTRILDALSSSTGNLALESAELEKLRLLKSGLMYDLLTGRTPVTALL
jgi:type I restriction enzyme, S subunit